MAFHSYDINELYSNADGTIQFIELVVSNNQGESFFNGIKISVIQSGTGTTNTYTFPSNLPSNASGAKSVLIATQGFADQGGVLPDFIVPSGFLFVGGGTVKFGWTSNINNPADEIAYTALPIDGTSLHQPANFWGTTGGADNITGWSGQLPNDYIASGSGNDTLNGAAGNDTLVGGTGDDYYIVDSLSDVILENDLEGNDTVQSLVDGYTLPANVEVLIPPDTMGGGGGGDTGGGGGGDIGGGGDASGGAGNTGDDVINGDAGDNSLDGGLGNDSLSGLDGDDSILGRDGSDVMLGNTGSDTLRGGAGDDEARGGQDEDFVYGGSDNDFVRGGPANDVVRGGLGADDVGAGPGNDTLGGGQGDDTLRGALGNDSLTGGAGADHFVFAAAGAADADTISDFAAGEDKIELVSSYFGALTAGGTLGPSQFQTFVLYDSGTGLLSYDVDGAGPGAALPIATLSTLPSLSAADILLA